MARTVTAACFVHGCMPIGTTFSFLIATSMVSEVALTYLAFGLGIAITAGWVISKLTLAGALGACKSMPAPRTCRR